MKLRHILFLSVFFIPAVAAGAGISRDLTVGAKGDDVKSLQEFLAKDKAVYPEGIVSGYFGAFTRAAVAKFQKREGISPAAGYVGPKTRSRIDQMLGAVSSISPAPIAAPQGNLADLLLQLGVLQRALADLQSATSTVATTTPRDTTPPSFIEGPTVTLGVPDVASPFRGDAAVRVTVNWKTNEPTAPSSFSCDPSIAVSGLSLQATYWARMAGRHVCTLAVEDASQNKTSQAMVFEVPAWTALGGSSTQPFADSSKLGDLKITNHATTSVVLFRVNITIEESIDAPNSRGVSYKLVLKDGTSNISDILEKKDVPMHSQFPGVGNLNRQFVNFYAGKTMAAGETKTLSLWVEGLSGPYNGGVFRMTVTDVTTIPEQAAVGTGQFSLSR
ncbi:MAG: peptidoglycan-binding protein [Candidatus Sungbacteria bacterium]|nr:peptidoglycan-binding protein [Candidatus Sungbacteria bacterium]